MASGKVSTRIPPGRLRESTALPAAGPEGSGLRTAEGHACWEGHAAGSHGGDGVSLPQPQEAHVCPARYVRSLREARDAGCRGPRAWGPAVSVLRRLWGAWEKGLLRLHTKAQDPSWL